MAGNMLMINVGVNSKDAENSLASLEETLKNISKQDAELKVGENLAAEVENARKKYLDMVKMVNSTEGELQKAFAISGLKQTIADVNALNKKIAETGAKIKPIELQSVMFDGKELFDIKGIDKSLDKFAKKLDKDSNDAFANILTTNLGQKFFSKQKNELEKQLETDLKDLAKDFSQDKLEQYINKYLKIRAIDVAKSGKDKIATSGVTPKAITDLIDNKAISKQLAEGKIDVKAMFQKKATDVGFVKNMKDQIFSELMVFLNQNTDANTFGTKYTDAQMTEMTQGAKESKKQIKLLKEEFIGLINQYNGFNRNSKIELVLDTVARIESLRKELKGLGQDISEINNIEKQDEYKENLNTLKYTLIPDGNDDYYDEDFDTYLLKLKNDFNKLNNTNIQSIMSMNIGDEKKIEKLKENLTQIDELLIKTNSYDSIVPNVSSEVIGDIEILKNQREQIIAGLKKLNVDVAGVGIPMADYIAGGNKGSGGNSSGTGSGDGDGNGTGSGTGNGGVMTPEETEKLKKDYADITAEVEKYKAQIAETTAKLEEMKKTQAESEGDKSKIKELQASLDALNVSYAEAQNKMKEYRSELAAYESMSLVQDANGNNVNQEQYDKLISDAKQTATELENTRNQLKMLQEQAAAGGSDEYVVQLNNQLKSTEAMLNKVTNELEYMESSRNRWMDRAEMNAVIDESGQSVYQNDYDNIVAKLSEMKTEAQNAKDELEKLKATSVQLGEGEQVAKTSDIEAVKELSGAVKSLQERMAKAEKILNDVPEGMRGLNELRNQITRMSGNFNEDGSIKNMGKTAEELAKQFNDLKAKFDEKINQKIAEVEKNSYKENQPQRKFELAESVKSLKIVAEQATPKVEAKRVDNNAEGSQQNVTVKTEEATQELYKETEAYKALSNAVQEFNNLTSKSLGEKDFDGRIQRLKDMQTLVSQIIDGVKGYSGNIDELAGLALQSKKGETSIQNIASLEGLLNYLKNGIAKTEANKEKDKELQGYIKNLDGVIVELEKKFQGILKPKLTKDNNQEVICDQLNKLYDDIKIQAEAYEKYKGLESYDQKIADRLATLQAKADEVSTGLYNANTLQDQKDVFNSFKAKYLKGYKPPKKKETASVEIGPTAEDLKAIENETKAKNENARATEAEIAVLERYQELRKKDKLTSEEKVEYSNLKAKINGAQKAPGNTQLPNVDPAKAEAITKALGTLSKALKDYETVNKNIELPKISGDTAQIDTIIPKMNELTKSLKDFKTAVTGIADSSVISGLDKLIEKLKNLSTSGKIDLQVSNVKSVNEEIDKFSKMIVEWAEAIQIQKKAGANEVERVALFNSKSGFLSNSYVSDKNDEVRDAVNREMIKRYQKEKVDTHIHSHPENIAAFSFDDLNNHIKRLEYGITKNLVVASKEVMKIDLSGITDKNEYTKFIVNLQENVNKQLSEYMYNQLKDVSAKKVLNNVLVGKSNRFAYEAAEKNNLDINQTVIETIDEKIHSYVLQYSKNPQKSNLQVSEIYKGLMSEFDNTVKQISPNNAIDKSKINQLRNEISKTVLNYIRSVSGLINEDEYQNAKKNFLLDGFKNSKYSNVLSVMSIEDFKKNNPALSQLTQGQNNQSSDNTKLDEIIQELKNISKQMGASTTKVNNNTSSKISTNQSPNHTPSGVTAPAISAEVQAASEASTAEVAAFKTIDGAVTKLTKDINTKTEAIRSEATEMVNAAKSEVASISQIKQAVSDLATQIHNVPKVRIVGENDGKLNISANLTEEQIAVIREKLKAAFSGEQAIPISFVPNVEGLKQQIADALKNVPVEITNNNINKVIKVNKFKANSDGVEALRNSISSQLKNVKIQSFDATTAAESVKETLSKVLDGVGLKFDTEKLGNEVREAVNSGVEAASAEQKPETSDNKAVRFKERATNDIGKLRDKYADKLQGQQLEVFKERLNEIDNKIKEIKDDASNYTDENAQVIDKDIKQIEALVNSFKEINNSEDKINSLIQKLKDSKNSIERRGAVAQPVVNNINSEMSALEELKRSGQNLNVGNPAEVQAFIDKLREADATVESLQQSAKDIRVSTNATASVAKLDSKFNDLLFKVDKFRRDNSKITSDKGISAQFDSLMRSIQTIEKSDVNFQRLRAQFDQLKATVQGKGLTGRSLGDELKYIAEKIGIKAMLGNSIYRVIGAFRQMVGIVTELDTGMTTLRRVTEETEATYRKFLKTAGDEAHELGSTVSGLVDSTGDFARLGYNIQEANALAKNAVMYSNVGWLDIQTATADMTSTMKAFNIEASDSIRIVDTFDILGKKLPLVTISVKGWRHSRPSKDIVNHNICVTTAGGVW